jgi:adenosylcobinamide kinase/adenosylcobinamide-phosphate guanylyltransferase
LKNTLLVIGGCRSGKSRYALERAAQISGENRYFIATCVPRDNEMKHRVDIHQKERGAQWQTVEAPLLLPEAILHCSRKADVVVVDCLTLWISNLLLEETENTDAFKHPGRLTDILSKAECPIILVSNEVGTGIVPENQLARQFRDMAGFANQKIAASVDEVVWMVAGIPVPIKGKNKNND